MKCPTCPSDLVMSERHGVEIGYCPTCRGVWLDRGELDKIIERASGELDSARRTERRRDDDDDDDRKRWTGGHAKKRKSSILGEIFDFG